MIEYRTFVNRDPARIAALWNGSPLGRGAATGIGVDAFETLNFAQPYFDRKGVILACDGDDVVGFTARRLRSQRRRDGPVLRGGRDLRRGCASELPAAGNRPRTRAAGRGLPARARSQNAAGGPSAPLDPFFFGLYGGSRPSGFMESDPDAAPFFTAMGYQPVERHGVYQCDLTTQRSPMSFRFVNVRRKMELTVSPEPSNVTWWWETRYGRLDTVQFSLHSKENPAEVAELTVVGLDLYLTAWQQRAVGLAELRTVTTELRKGYAQALWWKPAGA